MADLDEEIRRRREQKSERTAAGTAESLAINAKLKDLLQLIKASEELRREGFTAQIDNGRIALQRHGEAYGEWLIYDAWFEYRGQTGEEVQIYKAAWVEEAIALTSSIVTGVHVKARHANGRVERSRLTFSSSRMFAQRQPWRCNSSTGKCLAWAGVS